MRLVKFQVTHYRCVDRSGDITVDSKVTCLVGKNESGKTTVLQALRRLNPLHPATFDVVQDYPRRRLRQYQREQKRSGGPPATVVSAEFALDEDDTKAIAATFGCDVLAAPTMTWCVGYGPASTPDLDVDESALVAHLLSDSSWNGRANEFSDTNELLAALTSAADDPEAVGLVASVKPFTARPLAEQVWERVLKSRCPRLMYFDEYSVMAGKAPLTTLANAGQLANNDGLRTLKELLDLAGTTPQELMADSNYEHHKAELEATANDITAEVFEYWRQNPDLEVEFDVHRSQQQGDGAQATFYVRIKNRRHAVTVPFDERSRGFVWFFSFLVAFNKVVADGQPVVILLDEPGLNLHGKAQADLLRFIEDRLAPHHQVIYTTHSPFMVDAQHLDRTRTVEDVADQGTKVSADCLTSDPDTLFPLQAALGYDVAQSLFVGPNCLLVEGPSDLLYLQAMSRLVAMKGKAGLDERWVITPVGGADKLAAFVALMGGNKLNLAVLMDITKKDRQRVENLVARRLIERSHIVQVSTFSGNADADIEDLFEPGFYVGIAKAVLGESAKSLTLKSLPQGPRIVKRIEKALGGRRFDHYGVAVQLVERLDSGVDDQTAERFAKLFLTLNKLMPDA